MSATYAKAARDALPHAQLIVDRFHLVKRANQTVEAVRRRTTWQSRGRRGRKADPEWINRRRLLRGAERLTDAQRTRLVAALDAADPNGDILAAWIAKELLRDVLACTGGMRYDIAAALYRFYAFCAATSVPEIHDLAETIETWQAPMILAITTGLSNARSEGYNRIVKHVGRIAFGFRNPDNQRRRVRWACTRQSRQAPPRTRQLSPANSEEPDKTVTEAADKELRGSASARIACAELCVGVDAEHRHRAADQKRQRHPHSRQADQGVEPGAHHPAHTDRGGTGDARAELLPKRRVFRIVG